VTGLRGEREEESEKLRKERIERDAGRKEKPMKSVENGR